MERNNGCAGITGNLGADGSGHVDAYEFSTSLWRGFVKATCASDVGASGLPDAGVNHLIVRSQLIRFISTIIHYNAPILFNKTILKSIVIY